MKKDIKQILTREQIDALGEDAIHYFGADELKMLMSLARLNAGDPRPARRKGETTAEYHKRCEEHEPVYEEFLRENIVNVMRTQLNKDMAPRRVFSKPLLSPEEKAELDARLAADEERHRQADLEHGGYSVASDRASEGGTK